ncbi:FHA domain-containing protein [Mycobacterium sp. OAE908]|uniref:FHA domain-containing protein n=1 Tax=Mycobacterium sp. OAE908 TaxID=2817899 RepID=UPI001AE72A90
MTHAYTGPTTNEHGQAEAPALSITVGDTPPYTVEVVDAPITVGRGLEATMRIQDPRVSERHLLIECDGVNWALRDDGSTNGTYLDGALITAHWVTDGLTVHLGDANGIPVTFTHQRRNPNDPGLARAGRAFAVRREEMGFSQRKLSDDNVIGQSNLVAFEKGRSWPRNSTLAKLEQAVGWPAGTLARIRRGGPIPTESAETATEVLTDSVRVSVFLDAIRLHLDDIKGRVSALPPQTAPTFGAQAAELLTKLRQVQATAHEAAAGSKGPGIALLLSDIRRTYNDLVVRAAGAPGARLSHRLYAARHRAELTVEETANAAGLGAQTVADVEADRPVSPGDMAALESLIAQLAQH